MSRKCNSSDAWTNWLHAYAGERAHRFHDGVHTLVLGREFLLNVVHEPGSPARLVIFSTPGSMPAGTHEVEPAPDLVELDGSRRRVSVDQADGMVLLSRSVFADALDEAAFHVELTRHATTHLLWAALLLARPTRSSGARRQRWDWAVQPA